MKLAIIGSYGHVSVCLTNPAAAGVELVAAARWGDDDPMRFLGKFPSASQDLPVYDDYRKMIEEVRPDITGVFMPLYRNAEASIAAAEAGSHIISEKPLATELDDLADLRKAVERAGVRIAAAFTARCEAPFQTVRSVVKEGRIGEPVLISGQKSYPFADRDGFYRQRATYGGSIPWQGIHAIDFVTYCSGKDYARVAAMHSNFAHADYPGMEDNGAMIFELVGGGHAVIRFDYLRPWGSEKRPWGDERLRIAGTEGIVELVGSPARVVLTTPDASEDVPLLPQRDLLSEFVAYIRGEGEPLLTSEESFRITEVALLARQAADEGTIIDL